MTVSENRVGARPGVVALELCAQGEQCGGPAMNPSMSEIRQRVEHWCRQRPELVDQCWLAGTDRTVYIYLLPTGAEVLCRLEDEATVFEREVRREGQVSMRVTVCPPQHRQWLVSQGLPAGAEEICTPAN